MLQYSICKSGFNEAHTPDQTALANAVVNTIQVTSGGTEQSKHYSNVLVGCKDLGLAKMLVIRCFQMWSITVVVLCFATSVIGNQPGFGKIATAKSNKRSDPKGRYSTEF